MPQKTKEIIDKVGTYLRENNLTCSYEWNPDKNKGYLCEIPHGRHKKIDITRQERAYLQRQLRRAYSKNKREMTRIKEMLNSLNMDDEGKKEFGEAMTHFEPNKGKRGWLSE